MVNSKIVCLFTISPVGGVSRDRYIVADFGSEAWLETDTKY